MDRLKSILRSVRQPFLVTVVLLLICGLGYPLLLSGISAVIFPSQAGGDLVEYDGEVVGSIHVGQAFTEPYFMKGRPSAVGYNICYTDAEGNLVNEDGSPYGGPSSGSNNYGPSNPALAERVEADMEQILAANPGMTREDIPTDLATASGSGLDPHISPASAAFQIPAVAKASGLSEETLKQIVADNTTGKLLGIFGEEVVNVLGVNMDIAEQMGLSLSDSNS